MQLLAAEPVENAKNSLWEYRIENELGNLGIGCGLLLGPREY